MYRARDVQYPRSGKVVLGKSLVFGIHQQNGLQLGSAIAQSQVVGHSGILIPGCLEGGIRLEYVGNKIDWIGLPTTDT